ncbi:MAG: hypothetical protein LOD87_08100, partial [Planifilum fulgidum]
QVDSFLRWCILGQIIRDIVIDRDGQMRNRTDQCKDDADNDNQPFMFYYFFSKVYKSSSSLDLIL